MNKELSKLQLMEDVFIIIGLKCKKAKVTKIDTTATEFGYLSKNEAYADDERSYSDISDNTQVAYKTTSKVFVTEIDEATNKLIHSPIPLHKEEACIPVLWAKTKEELKQQIFGDD